MGKFDVADELLTASPAVVETKQQEVNWDVAGELLSPSYDAPTPMPMEPTANPIGIKPTNEISTITGKPISEFDQQSPDFASFGTLAKAGLVHDKQAKMQIYADARGIPVDRYAEVDGKIAFLDGEGVVRLEEESGFTSDKLKKMAATTFTNPSVVLGTVGAAAGPAGAATGGMAGETVRQLAAGLFLGDPQTPLGNIADLGLEASLGLIAGYGGVAARGTVNLARQFGKKSGRFLNKAIDFDFDSLNLKRMAKIQRVGKQFGIDVWPAQAAKNQEMITALKMLRDSPQTAGKLKLLAEIEEEQIQKAVPKFLDTIAPAGDKLNVGRELVTKAKGSIRTLKDNRSAVAKPFYDASFSDKTPIDVDHIVKYLDDMISTAKGDQRSALNKIKDDLVKPRATDAVKLYGPDGKLIQLPDRLTTEQGHSLQMSYGDRLGRLSRREGSAVDNTISRQLYHVKDMLITAMENQNRVYKIASGTYANLSDPVNEATKGIIGKLSKLEGDDLVGATSLLLASKNARKETIKIAKENIIAQPGGVEAWDASVRNFLEYKFDSIVDKSVGDKAVNIGGHFYKKILGNQNQRDIIEEALGPQKFKAMEDFFEVLRATGATFGSESTTAVRQEMQKKWSTVFRGKVVTAVTQPLQSPKILLGNKINQKMYDQGMKDLLKHLMDEKSILELNKLKKLKPGSAALIQGVTAFIELSSAQELEQEIR